MLESLNQLARILLKSQTATAAMVPWASLGPEHVDAILGSLAERYAPATANKHLAALRGVVRAARRMQLITAEQMINLLDFKGYKNDRPLAGRCLSQAEIAALFKICRVGYGYQGAYADIERDAAVLVLACCAGLRRFEIAALNVSSYGREHGIVRVAGKGDKIRDVPLNPTGQDLLNRWLSTYTTALLTRKKPLLAEMPLVCRFHHRVPTTRLSGDGVYGVLLRLGERAGVTNFSPHDLRRTYITELLERGNDPFTVARLAGHKDAKTTMLYDRRGANAARVAAHTLATMIPVMPMPPPTWGEMFNVDDPRRGYELGKDVERLNRLHREGLISVSEVVLPQFADCVDKDLGQFQGGPQHQRFCCIAKEWLRQQGHSTTIETSYVGGRCDVAAQDGLIYAECGNTPASKPILCCQYSKRLLLLPFETDPPRGFLFERGPKGDADAWRRESDAHWERTGKRAFEAMPEVEAAAKPR